MFYLFQDCASRGVGVCSCHQDHPPGSSTKVIHTGHPHGSSISGHPTGLSMLSYIEV
ncbi:uncharacterized protein Dmoj_GI26341, isoform B [Drosophila mojavensis]|uniref:Uncharacterized protein, isoform B n=1 Tax=Drosophila mojavensis TaxID=7230 RepID=A0A0Q9XC01_DROMO|nr:uncharacterized protein Dmoj_GI26681 [Drosophila mojavensis]KRG02453.1 uncharacterized protein Dmoj_GI25633 [Drosophila mojavensis]KRG07853.1 uncharacterized protein Dmoj_GI26935 [Drosophila mojavensis]KRG07868.1 uncharacterized protein Dmoj_GI26341, isoform B [Drosophila mojavensis]